MKVEDFTSIIGTDLYVGVPDSQLKALCDYLYDTYGANTKHHIIAANEGNAVGIAAGYHLATGKIAVVYMQNSGEGNVVNPVVSLLNEKVYGIPCIFVIGWRGEPEVHDEPQHIYQGEITCKLLELMGVEYTVVSPNSSTEDMDTVMKQNRERLKYGQSVAFIIRKGALSYDKRVEYKNSYKLTREEAIRHIVDIAIDDLIVCTTGKASRELFEIRKANGQGHEHDFLTVGSMGHASSIALGIALNTDRRVWCIDGDGAMLMHMGVMATIGSIHPSNLIHVIINNESHETVGGMPTVSKYMEVGRVSTACGYPVVHVVSTVEQLMEALQDAKNSDVLELIEVRCRIGARADLGRPTTAPSENKKAFMENIKGYMENINSAVFQ